MKLVLGEWTPDIVAIAGTGLQDARNVVPAVDGYEQLGSMSPKTAAVSEKVLSGAWFLDEDNASQTFAGTGVGLYKRTDGTDWTDLSQETPYTGSYWEFAKWGNQVIACNYADATQYIDMTIGTEFDDLPNAPKARRVAVVRDFVVFGDTAEGSDTFPNRVRWSGFNNAQSYGSSLATQADYQDLIGNGGRIQKIVSGATGVIFQQHSIWYMDYQGPPTVFSFREVEPGRGTPAANSVCWFGSQIYFYSHDGFYVHTVGGGSRPIGEAKVNRWFLNRVDPERMDEMHGIVDRENNRVVWAFASTGGSANCDYLLIYDVASGRWSYALADIETLVELISPSYNLDTLDTLFEDIDSESIPMDTRAYLGGALLVAAWNGSHELCTFDGPPLEAQLTTGEIGGESRIWIHRVRPIINRAAGLSMRIGSRANLDASIDWSPPAYPNASGVIRFRRNNRYHRFRINIAGGFNRASGLDIDLTQGGVR
jgi:hypothetical protein